VISVDTASPPTTARASGAWASAPSPMPMKLWHILLFYNEFLSLQITREPIFYVVMWRVPPTADLLLRNGRIVDGTGQPGYVADLAIGDGKILAIGKNLTLSAAKEIDTRDHVISPGFIDMLSWACGPILYDGSVASVVGQGITTAIFGEGWSMGPVNENVRTEMKNWWPEYEIDYTWETLADYLHHVEQKGTSVNIGSFVGATTIRIHELGFENRAPALAELEKMQELVRREMNAGAFGVASSLVYTPAFYAGTEELIALSRVAAEYGGIYASHIRGEGRDLLTALQELITISEQAAVPAEIYHFKAAGKENWSKLQPAIDMINRARERDLDITADIYPYTAGATQLKAMIPPWAKEGGDREMLKRLRHPAIKARIRQEILQRYDGWENFYWMAGGGAGILISSLSAANQHYQGKTIVRVAQERGKDEIAAVFDLLESENGGGGGIYFLMSEANVRIKMSLPWVIFCTDEHAYRPQGLMGQRNPHPRAYGTFPRILGRYVREEQVLSLEDAIRRMSGLVAQRLGIVDRGILKQGMAADIVIFNPQTVIDRAEYIEPHQFPEGIEYVIVNGEIVVAKGRPTGAKPGKAIFRPLP
jgi:N-acyl-D-amino-acid deacylase